MASPHGEATANGQRGRRGQGHGRDKAEPADPQGLKIPRHEVGRCTYSGGGRCPVEVRLTAGCGCAPKGFRANGREAAAPWVILRCVTRRSTSRDSYPKIPAALERELHESGALGRDGHVETAWPVQLLKLEVNGVNRPVVDGGSRAMRFMRMNVLALTEDLMILRTPALVYSSWVAGVVGGPAFY